MWPLFPSPIKGQILGLCWFPTDSMQSLEFTVVWWWWRWTFWKMQLFASFPRMTWNDWHWSLLCVRHQYRNRSVKRTICCFRGTISAGCSDCMQPPGVLLSRWGYQVCYHRTCTDTSTCPARQLLATSAIAGNAVQKCLHMNSNFKTQIVLVSFLFLYDLNKQDMF